MLKKLFFSLLLFGAGALYWPPLPVERDFSAYRENYRLGRCSAFLCQSPKRIKARLPRENTAERKEAEVKQTPSAALAVQAERNLESAAPVIYDVFNPAWNKEETMSGALTLAGESVESFSLQAGDIDGHVYRSRLNKVFNFQGRKARLSEMGTDVIALKLVSASELRTVYYKRRNSSLSEDLLERMKTADRQAGEYLGQENTLPALVMENAIMSELERFERHKRLSGI